jgi:dehydrogenase/reductase SDR family protein 7B
MLKIQGKIAWITGASSGIGEALASELFSQGATVILSARNRDKLNELKTRFDFRDKNRCFIVPCDVTRQTEIDQAVNEVKSLVDHIDLLINNAGISQRSYTLDTSLSVDRQLFEVNFFGTVAITKAILPWMISKGGGHIVVISSMAGKYGFRMRSSYSASKHALHGFFETLRAELHDKQVGVTIVCPGRVKTDISINSVTGDGKKYGIMDAGQKNGVPVEKCARIIVRAIKAKRKEVFIGGRELFLLTVKRFCPPLYYWIVNRASPT